VDVDVSVIYVYIVSVGVSEVTNTITQHLLSLFEICSHWQATDPQSSVSVIGSGAEIIPKTYQQ
jgi:hypothetical protein